MLQELGDLIARLKKPNADPPPPARRTNEGPIAQRAHVAALLLKANPRSAQPDFSASRIADP